jgi:hypothetical protein
MHNWSPDWKCVIIIIIIIVIVMKYMSCGDISPGKPYSTGKPVL